MDEEKFGQAKRNVRETIGDATDNKDLKAGGKGDKAPGKAKKIVDGVKDGVNNLIDKAKGGKN